MFGRHNESRRRANPILSFFRLILSIIVFLVLITGIYFAYKQFSGYDPLKLDLRNVTALLITNPALGKVSDKIGEFFKIPPPLKALGIKGKEKIIPSDNGFNNEKQFSTGSIDFSFVIVSDSHSDNENLSKALAQAKSINSAFIIGLGDYTKVGTITELKNAKKEFDSAGIRYFLVPGDHDLWDSRDKGHDPGTNFKQVFGLTYQSFVYKDYEFILINNADNYKGISEEQNVWLLDILKKSKEQNFKGIFVMMQEPLYHPSSDHVMGKSDPKIESQAKALIYELKEAGVKMVFAGDVHFYTKYKDPGTNLDMVTSGAITSSPNTQAPRFIKVEVFQDGSFVVNDVEIR